MEAAEEERLQREQELLREQFERERQSKRGASKGDQVGAVGAAQWPRQAKQAARGPARTTPLGPDMQGLTSCTQPRKRFHA